MRCSEIAGYDTINCCSSCHEDEDLGYDGGVILDYAAEEEIIVCCKAKQWFVSQLNKISKET